MIERRILKLLITVPEMSNRHMGRVLGCPHSTVRNYRKKVKRFQLTAADVCTMDDDAIIRFLRGRRHCETSKRQPDWKYVHTQMQIRFVTLELLWEEYAAIDPNTAYSRSQFCALYREYVNKLDISMRQTRRAGEKIYVDFAGYQIPWVDRQTGEIHWAYVFVATVGCSNYTFAFAVFSQSIADWILAHERMLRFFGMRSQFIVCDNLKAAVIKAGLDLRLNPIYEDFADHYEIIIDPARPHRPKDKAPVEKGVQLVSRWLARLRHRQFSDIGEINAAIEELLPQLNERPFKRNKSECRRSLFEKIDRPMMSSLRTDPYIFADRIGPIKADSTYHVSILGHSYSIPYTLAHQLVEARVSINTVEIFRKGRRVASHVRSHIVGGTTTDDAHHPPKFRSYAQQEPARYVEWAETIGSAALAVVQHQFAEKLRPTHAMRACSKLQQLARENGHERFEAACRRAQAIGSLTVTSVSSILRRKLEHIDADLPTQTHLPLDHNVRGPGYYAAAAGGR